MTAYDLKKARFHATLELLRPFPLRQALRLVDGLSAVFYHSHPGARRQAAELLEQILPPGDARRQQVPTMVRTMFRLAAMDWYGKDLMMRHDVRDYPDLLQVEGVERLAAALRRGKGAVLLSSHVGFPRFLRWHLRSRPEFPVLYLIRLGRAAPGSRGFRDRIDLWYRRRFSLDDERMAGWEGFRPAFLHKAYHHLRANGVVNLAADGGIGSEDGVAVRIAGREVRFAPGAQALALMSGAAMLPCFGWLEPGPRFRGEIQEELPVVRTADARRDRERAAGLYAERVQQFLLAHPDNFAGSRYSLKLPV